MKFVAFANGFGCSTGNGFCGGKEEIGLIRANIGWDWLFL